MNDKSLTKISTWRMKDKGLRGFIGTLKCLVGLHEWTWSFERGSMLILDAPPPANARCSRCGKVYGRNVKQCGNVVMGDMAGGDIVKTKQPNAGI
jgi:hypothetical protein